MRRTLLAFFGLAFLIYWFWTADLPQESPETLDPVIPSLVRVTASLPGKVKLFVHKQLNSEGDLRGWLRSEAQRVGRVDPDPAATFKRLKEHASRLRASELKWLRNMAVDSSASGDERYLAVYMIGLSDTPAAMEKLKEIATSPVPSSNNDRQYSDEVVVRAHALESVVHRLSSSEAVRYLRDVLSKTTDPAVARHAQYWISRFG